jgi:hypothetical protein
VDDEAGERPDHGSVDADELQIAPGEQLDPAGRLHAVPARDLAHHQGGELVGVVVDGVEDHALEQLLDARAQHRFVEHALRVADDGVGQPPDRDRVTVGQRRLERRGESLDDLDEPVVEGRVVEDAQRLLVDPCGHGVVGLQLLGW